MGDFPERCFFIWKLQVPAVAEAYGMAASVVRYGAELSGILGADLGLQRRRADSLGFVEKNWFSLYFTANFVHVQYHLGKQNLEKKDLEKRIRRKRNASDYYNRKDG